MQGVIIHYDSTRGFGFIKMRDQKENIFFHVSDVDQKEKVAIGREVSFNRIETPKGSQAVRIQTGRLQKSPLFNFLSIAFLLTAGDTLLFAIQFDLSWLLSYLIAINISTLLLYGYDKLIAGTNSLRVPESVLHIVTIAGGTPAAMVGQKYLRHKTLKESFQLRFLFIICMQIIAIFAWIAYQS